MEDLRLIANPHLLADDVKKNPIKRDNLFLERLKDLLREEYQNIYLSEKTINKIKLHIDTEINNLMIDRIVEECLEACIEEVINLNKFDFCLPFD